ncbi:MAG: methylated-DNA--[protein]-cysteine S-methyltransferase [Gaiellaceae bacterium]
MTVATELQNETFVMPRSTGRTFVDTPIGLLMIEASEIGLTHVVISSSGIEKTREPEPEPGSILARAKRQFEEYFTGARREFDLPFDLDANDFVQRVRDEAVAHVPYGGTVSYGELAAMAGSPRAARAAGNVMRSNPLMIVIPCHRVVGADGSLRGYGGLGCGLSVKRWLLDFESTSGAGLQSGT